MFGPVINTWKNIKQAALAVLLYQQSFCNNKSKVNTHPALLYAYWLRWISLKNQQVDVVVSERLLIASESSSSDNHRKVFPAAMFVRINFFSAYILNRSNPGQPIIDFTEKKLGEKEHRKLMYVNKISSNCSINYENYNILIVWIALVSPVFFWSFDLSEAFSVDYFRRKTRQTQIIRARGKLRRMKANTAWTNFYRQPWRRYRSGNFIVKQ